MSAGIVPYVKDASSGRYHALLQMEDKKVGSQYKLALALIGGKKTKMTEKVSQDMHWCQTAQREFEEEVCGVNQPHSEVRLGAAACGTLFPMQDVLPVEQPIPVHS